MSNRRIIPIKLTNPRLSAAHTLFTSDYIVETCPAIANLAFQHISALSDAPSIVFDQHYRLFIKSLCLISANNPNVLAMVGKILEVLEEFGGEMQLEREMETDGWDGMHGDLENLEVDVCGVNGKVERGDELLFEVECPTPFITTLRHLPTPSPSPLEKPPKMVSSLQESRAGAPNNRQFRAFYNILTCFCALYPQIPKSILVHLLAVDEKLNKNSTDSVWGSHYKVLKVQLQIISSEIPEIESFTGRVLDALEPVGEDILRKEMEEDGWDGIEDVLEELELEMNEGFELLEVVDGEVVLSAAGRALV